ncbi:MAG: DUF4411 family protein [Gammaproteobacteria bacterium]
MTPDAAYIVDSDVFISAKNGYYAFVICPGFWASLIDHHRTGRVHSLDHIKDELLAGNEEEDLVQWVKRSVPSDFFLSTRDTEVAAAYTEIMLWVQRNPQYYDNAKAKFATEADGWLVAYARVHGMEVVTNEQPRPESRNRILLPDVCNAFDVVFHDTFAMLKTLQVSYEYTDQA